jgi:hypothetical protein
MPAAVAAEALARIASIKAFLRWIDQQEKPSTPGDSAARAAKGLFFVQTYGVYEFTVTSAVRTLAAHLNNRSHPIRDIRPELLSMVLDAEFASVVDGSLKKTWANRMALFRRASCSDPSALHEGLFPKDGSQYRFTQLQLVWELFGIPSPVLPHPRFSRYIDEMVENRNRIAHGNESAELVGRRYTIADLDVRANDVEHLCTHITSAFSSFLGQPNAFLA